MAVSHCLESYLAVARVQYQVVPHPFTETSYAAACAAHVPAASMVKAVMLRDRPVEQFSMALIPASNRLNLAWLPESMRGEMSLAREADFGGLFPDCVWGAIPGFGQAYRMDMIWDDSLLEHKDLYFEAGDHEALVKIDQEDFRDLFCQYPHSSISMPEGTADQSHSDQLRAGMH